jgi:hypothetical protein
VPPGEHHGRISRRAALRLGAGAGLTAASVPYLTRAGFDLRAGDRRAVDLSDARLALTPRPTWPAPPIVTRSQWGANEALRKPGQVYDAPIRKIIVHHTATPNDVTNYAGLCRSIMQSEVAGEFIDIAYNWLIDPLGRIYEGRWAADYPSGTTHTGELNARNVRGGHALNHNRETIGIALMGNYQQIAPSNAMINALVTLVTWKCARWGLNPLGGDPYTNGAGAVISVPNVCGHRHVNATACPGDHVDARLASIRQQVAGKMSSTGYWVATSLGQVFAYGGAPDAGDTNRLSLPSWIVAIAAHPSGFGYWTLGIDGGVFTFGNARFFGSTGGMRLNAPVVGLAPTPSGNGYWLVANDGGIFSFGDARFFGSTGGMRLNAPILGMARTPTGRGYWLFARDGGIFSFGDARFFGSTGSIRLVQPIVGMCARPQGDGYWLVAADGGVFAFGHAPFFGSGAGRIASRVVSMAATTTGRGYVIVAENGTVLAFGDAPNLGGPKGFVFGSAVGIAGKISPLT